MTDALVLFQETIQAVYGQLGCIPIADGAIHRFRLPDDKPGKQSGWYVLYMDGIASAAFGSWKTGLTNIWSSRAPVDYREAEQVRQHIEQARRQRDAEKQRRQQQTAVLANSWWRDSRKADPAHPYLVAKGAHPHGLRQRDDELLVPLSTSGVLVNLQRVAPDGRKRFLFGGRVAGAYSALGQLTPEKPLYLCEGWATGATINSETGAAVACAMNAGNLLEVGRWLQRQHPDTVLIVAGDDDRQTEGNPGRLYATKAASALGCGLVFPQWPEDAPDSLSDFNDLRQWREARQ